MSNITLADLRTTKKVIRYMRGEVKKSPSYKNPEGETIYNMLGVLIQYADDLREQINKEVK